MNIYNSTLEQISSENNKRMFVLISERLYWNPSGDICEEKKPTWHPCRENEIIKLWPQVK